MQFGFSTATCCEADVHIVRYAPGKVSCIPNKSIGAYSMNKDEQNKTAINLDDMVSQILEKKYDKDCRGKFKKRLLRFLFENLKLHIFCCHKVKWGKNMID